MTLDEARALRDTYAEEISVAQREGRHPECERRFGELCAEGLSWRLPTK